MAQSFSTSVVSESGPSYPITASTNGMAQGLIPVRHAPAPAAIGQAEVRSPEPRLLERTLGLPEAPRRKAA